MRKGVTPVIAIIVLLFITIALAGAAWTYMQGFLFTQISKSFQIPTNGAYCEGGKINIYVVNTAYKGALQESDFILHDIDGTNANLVTANFPIAEGAAALIVSDDNSGSGWTGYHTVNLGTSSTIVHERVFCP